jgi:hypothetical protein
MAEVTLQVTEWMADFIGWANAQGEEKIRNMVREHLAEIKRQNEISKDSHVDEGFKWDDALEPNDGVDQWKHGGDCTLCRKVNFCGTKCRANKLLKKITTPFLYQQYITEHPEAAAKQIGGMDPEKLMKQLGVLQ